jgi:hypothetical protein
VVVAAAELVLRARLRILAATTRPVMVESELLHP